MRIVNWVGPSNSATTGKAIIELDPGESADITDILKLVDSGPTFGFTIKSLEMTPVLNEWKAKTRWIEVTVNRD